MVAISIMIEGQQGLTWPRWKRLVEETEALGFAGLFRSDHFTGPEAPDQDSLETIISLAYVADRTQRIHFGPLVAPISFRDPVNLARQAAAIDDLSGGRFLLGLGAGWQDREHNLFGYELGDTKTRMARYEEGLEVIVRLLRSDEPVTFEGRFYTLRGATLLPRPQRPGGPRIMIGGNGLKRTLSLAARYADVWNGVFISPEAFKERSTILDTFLTQEGRKPTDVKRTLMHELIFGRDEADLERKLSNRELELELRGTTVAETVAKLQANSRAVVGTPDQLVQQIKAYEQAGVEEIMLQWLNMDDIEGLRAFAQSVLPRI
jgi:F420-dependent oxidoreductase-like protein